MKKPFRKRRLFRVLLYTGIGLAILLIAIQLLITFYLDGRIRRELEESVFRETKGQYELHIRSLRTSIIGKSVFLSGCLFKSTNQSKDSTQYVVSARRIHLVNIDLMHFIRHKDLMISAIVLHDLKIRIAGQGRKQKEREKFSLYAILRKQMKSLLIRRIRIKDAELSIHTGSGEDKVAITSRDNEINVLNLYVDSSVDHSGRVFKAEKLDVSVYRFAYTTADSFYSFKVKRIYASYGSGILSMDSISLQPNYGKQEFSRRFGHQTDRLDIKAESLVFYNADIKSFFESTAFVSNNASVSHLDIEAYRDRNFPRNPDKGKSPTLQELVKRIPIYVAVDSLNIMDASVTYQEVATGESKPGTVTFTHMNGTLTGLTNDNRNIPGHRNIRVQAGGRLMEQASFWASYNFPMEEGGGTEFMCTGKIFRMPLEAINRMLAINTNIAVRGGVMDSMVFSFEAYHNASRGTMKFAYHDLQVQILKDEDTKRRINMPEVMSFVANTLILKADNPTGHRPIRVTAISCPNPGRFIFNYTWKSLLSGIKPAVGLPEPKGKISFD